VPEPSILFADCGCRFRIRVPLGSQTGELVRDMDCGTHLDIRTGRVAEVSLQQDDQPESRRPSGWGNA